MQRILSPMLMKGYFADPMLFRPLLREVRDNNTGLLLKASSTYVDSNNPPGPAYGIEQIYLDVKSTNITMGYWRSDYYPDQWILVRTFNILCT